MSGGLTSSSRAMYNENTATRTAPLSMSHPCNLERMPSRLSQRILRDVRVSRQCSHRRWNDRTRNTPEPQAGSRNWPVSFVVSDKVSQTWEIAVSARNIGV